MRKLLFLFFTLLLLSICLIYKNEIVSYLVNTFSNMNKNISKIENNKYASNNNYEYVQITDNFEPNNKKDIINIYYTILNSGMDQFSFYCPSSYKDCMDDVNYISNNQSLLSNINNFVPVYNIFQNIETEFDNFGKITVNITHSYNDDEILAIEDKIKNIINEILNDSMNLEEKIKAIHDYIINNTKYDVNRTDNKITKYHSDIAYGALIEHYAICGGYADSMKLFLDYLNVPNYKISSENHIWNLVYLNNNWYHLDLTWDDPVTSTGKDVLEYDYFLISTDELKAIETEQHVFDNSIYKEALKSN